MLSQVELGRIAEALTAEFVGGRIERWVEPERGRLAFTIYRRDASGKRKATLGIDVRPELARVGLLDRMPAAPDSLPAFSAYLRAHLGRARLERAVLRGDDRQLALRFSAREGEYTLLLSIFGRRSNLYLLDGAEAIVLALRPLAETRAELALGDRWADPGSAAPQRGEDRFAGLEGLDLLEAVEARYAEAIGDRTADEDRRRLAQALKKERKTAERRLERIEAELAEADQATTLQAHGELLKANLGRIEAGASEITVDDFTSGEPVTIQLDPKKSPKENLDAIFKRYQKLLRRLTKAGGQVDGAQEAIDRMRALEEELATTDALDALLARDDVKKILGRHATKPGATSVSKGPEKPPLPQAYRNLPRKLHPRRYRSAEDLEIWVGRSDEANDVLTTRLARGKDLFFHLDGAPGSHVILRTEGRDDPPPDAVIDACELAVHFSKQKNAGRADVHVVPIKNVKKPKGAKRGLVYVTGGKSIHLRREPDRLERLLESKIDD
ncbi:MAG: NFACT RNA binding domain-containing protein [Myxococcota bacterium]